ncbi:hypothetical protein O3M35_010249 [Rhynocoris fuscipes]|uniref:Geminin n=1 Tax=Rhynocoris fuscipes TaxID=488301 RepID=A0AAW1CY68_9HEMI
MKTELISTSVNFEESKSTLTDDKTLVKTSRRSLHPLQNSALDKENLVGAGRSSLFMTPNKGKINVISEGKSAKKLKISKSLDIKSSKASSDINNDEPGKEYYKILAERRRVALEEALKENEKLHARVKHLEEENEQCNILLNETRQLVETLTVSFINFFFFYYYLINHHTLHYTHAPITQPY